MRRFRLTKKDRALLKKETSRLFPLATLYLLFCIVSQLTSPTTASFNDTVTIAGNLSATNEFDQHRQDNHTDADRTDQETDKKAPHKERGQDKGVIIDEDVNNQTSVSNGHNETDDGKEITEPTLDSQTSDHISKMDSQTAAEEDNSEDAP